jgi:hypothetical protein
LTLDAALIDAARVARAIFVRDALVEPIAIAVAIVRLSSALAAAAQQRERKARKPKQVSE